MAPTRIRSLSSTSRALALLVIACDPGPSPAGGGLLEGVEIDLLEAMAIAAEHEPGGLTLDAELTAEDGDDPSYDVDRYVDGETRELVIDARTGEVVRVRIDAEDQLDGAEEAAALEASTGMITLPIAVERAMAAEDGQAVAVELDGDAGSIEVVLLRGDERLVVAIDLDDGSVLHVDDAPPADD